MQRPQRRPELPASSLRSRSSGSSASGVTGTSVRSSSSSRGAWEGRAGTQSRLDGPWACRRAGVDAVTRRCTPGGSSCTTPSYPQKLGITPAAGCVGAIGTATVTAVNPRQPVPPTLRSLADLQSGVVSREQVFGTGLPRSGLIRLLGEGTWQRSAPGIYLTVPGPASWSAEAWAGVLIGGDRARIGGLAAAHLTRVGGRWTPADRGLGASRLPQARRRTVDVPAGTGGRPAGPDCGLATSAHSRGHGAGPRRRPRLLRPRGRQLVGHGRPGPPHHTPNVSSRRPLAGTSCFTAISSAAAWTTSRSGYAARSNTTLCTRSNEPTICPRVAAKPAARHTEVDVLSEEFGLIVELDGRLGHTGMGRFRDMRRDNRSTTDGLATLRYGKADVFGIPCEVADEVAVNLMRRGWDRPREDPVSELPTGGVSDLRSRSVVDFDPGVDSASGHPLADGWINGTSPDQLAASTVSRLGGVSTSAVPAGRRTGSASQAKLQRRSPSLSTSQAWSSMTTIAPSGRSAYAARCVRGPWRLSSSRSACSRRSIRSARSRPDAGRPNGGRIAGSPPGGTARTAGAPRPGRSPRPGRTAR